MALTPSDIPKALQQALADDRDSDGGDHDQWVRSVTMHGFTKHVNDLIALYGLAVDDVIAYIQTPA